MFSNWLGEHFRATNPLDVNNIFSIEVIILNKYLFVSFRIKHQTLMWPSTEMTVALRSFDLETPALHHA